jgi:hypothetical protein
MKDAIGYLTASIGEPGRSGSGLTAQQFGIEALSIARIL